MPRLAKGSSARLWDILKWTSLQSRRAGIIVSSAAPTSARGIGSAIRSTLAATAIATGRRATRRGRSATMPTNNSTAIQIGDGDAMNTLNEDRFSFVPIDKAIEPPSGLIEHLKNKWWIVHPEKGVAFFEGKFAQCNSNEILARRLASGYPWAEVRFLPSVFRSINPQDYC